VNVAVHPNRLRSLALCAGIGGLDLGVKLARPDHCLVGVVERQAYCAAVLVERMGEAALDPAPIWDDLATFDGRRWRGAVDLITAGYPCQPEIPPVDWISVSPHGCAPAQFQQRYGHEIKLVDNLNGLDLETWLSIWPDDKTDFMYRYVQPLSRIDDARREDPESLKRCLNFLRDHPRWSLSRQDHHYWGVP
jgi:hypothetical protein